MARRFFFFKGVFQQTKLCECTKEGKSNCKLEQKARSWWSIFIVLMYHFSSGQATKGHFAFMASVENSLRWGSNLKEQCQTPSGPRWPFAASAERSKSLTEGSGDVFRLPAPRPPPPSHFNSPIQYETVYDKEMDCRVNALNSPLLNPSF